MKMELKTVRRHYSLELLTTTLKGVTTMAQTPSIILTRPLTTLLPQEKVEQEAQRLCVPALTADRTWLELSVGAVVQVIR